MQIGDIFKNLALPTILFTYFLFCGGLYTYSYWSTFDVDPSTLISLTDISKNFVFPLIKGQGISLLIGIFLNLGFKWAAENDAKRITQTLKTFGEESIEFNKVIKEEKKTRRLMLVNVCVATVCVVALIIRTGLWYQIKTSIAWMVSIFIVYKLKNLPALERLIPSLWTRIFLCIAITTPIVYSYNSGVNESNYILSNYQYKYVQFLKQDTSCNFSRDSLKLLGFLGDRTIVSTIDNKKIFYVQNDSYDNLLLINNTELDKIKSNKVNPPNIKTAKFQLLDSTIKPKKMASDSSEN